MKVRSPHDEGNGLKKVRKKESHQMEPAPPLASSDVLSGLSEPAGEEVSGAM